jgi:hypothetical protein
VFFLKTQKGAQIMNTGRKSEINILKNGLIQECLKILGLPTNPVGKTASVVICKAGRRLDYGMGGDPIIRNYKILKERMGVILSAQAWIDPPGLVVLKLYIARESGEGGYEDNLGISVACHKFSFIKTKMSSKGDWKFHDEAPNIDDMREEKIKIILRILE